MSDQNNLVCTITSAGVGALEVEQELLAIECRRAGPEGPPPDCRCNRCHGLRGIRGVIRTLDRGATTPDPPLPRGARSIFDIQDPRPPVPHEWWCDNCRAVPKLIAEVKRLRANARHDARGIHTCSPVCSRPACVMRRERDEARAEVRRQKAVVARKTKVEDDTLALALKRSRERDEARALLREARGLIDDMSDVIQCGCPDASRWTDDVAGRVDDLETRIDAALGEGS